MPKPFPKEGRLLVRLPNWIGDAVMASPVLVNLATYFEEISLIARPHILELFKGFPKLGNLYEIRSSQKDIWLLAKKIKNKYKVGILLPNSFSSALNFYLAGVKARAGYRTDGRGFLLTHGIAKPKGTMHQRDYYLNLLAQLGFEVKFRELKLFLKEDAYEKALRFLTNLPKPWAGLAPGAAFGPAKQWPQARYRALAYHLRRLGYSILVLGGEKEKSVGDEIVKDLPRARNLCGLLDLATSAGIIARLNLFVSNDSGLMHVAAALGVPQVAIFGSTSPLVSGPINPRAKVVYKEVPCSPCFSRSCDKGYICFEKISVTQVLEACQEVTQT
ncbi:lipopolysaccharide heptosyltransferase II [Thermodesulfatator indicus DSM 15286]|uniref:lipopolysaccharide heptosyltransferase II n=1 Tax=Thermodesulfatator indicus (strain DSM 15286 / JCM 11887 / CIR29812) TaxID=667014 RepID=F8A952_THEID|nr:lipopolysaccharide heptosyltransferase II [Thermodesulfatator indicus]AEH45180.1 lipopolysaccharide heptosyltransferase II [Thermodesulfatator indicus DSM 15286]